MVATTQTVANKSNYQAEDPRKVLFHKLDEAIDDMEQGKVQSLEEAWEEIDAI